MLNPERRSSPTSAITRDGALSLGYRAAYQQVSKPRISESHQIVGVSADLTEAHDEHKIAHSSFRELVLLQILSVNSINHVANLESNDF
ncbi:hypothetical protein PGTUg99_029532 [Puccinia graminis f. sp. tritici]|uniref:Uncharacterized protein n=1 Tax=Puccinia graminis f. sp. tritici TaxID=56615 RepID=A0A5B0SLS2_PUCGR|nr:hypothetical protein PGTUg99_029532 [Puccinia graminis f. sp. tritici]